MDDDDDGHVLFALARCGDAIDHLTAELTSVQKQTKTRHSQIDDIERSYQVLSEELQETQHLYVEKKAEWKSLSVIKSHDYSTEIGNGTREQLLATYINELAQYRAKCEIALVEAQALQTYETSLQVQIDELNHETLEAAATLERVHALEQELEITETLQAQLELKTAALRDENTQLVTRLIELQQVHAQTRDAYLASVSRYEELVTEDAQVTARLNAVIERCAQLDMMKHKCASDTRVLQRLLISERSEREAAEERFLDQQQKLRAAIEGKDVEPNLWSRILCCFGRA